MGRWGDAARGRGATRRWGDRAIGRRNKVESHRRLSFAASPRPHVAPSPHRPIALPPRRSSFLLEAYPERQAQRRPLRIGGVDEACVIALLGALDGIDS